MNPVNWDDLRHFLAAYRERSLAGAARVLGCEYTTVSRRLNALEAALGSTLFLRTPDGLSPTPFADDVLPLAEQAERASEAIALRAARREDEREEGTVRVTCLDGFSIYVAEQLAELHQRHPKIVVELVTDVRPLDLLRGEADIALRMSPTKERDLVTRSLCVMNWRLFATKEYLERRGTPQPLTDLAGHDVIGFDASLDHVPGAIWLAEHGRAATIVSRGNSVRSVVDAAAAGLGLAALPHFLASREPRLQLVGSDILGTRPLSLVTHADLKDVARVRAVIDFLVVAILRDHARGAFG